MELLIQPDMNKGVKVKIITLPAAAFLVILTITNNSYASPVNINTADAGLIAKSLSGIGKHKATAIIYYRKKHGLFEQPADIVNVKGIGKATYNRNRTDILIK